MAGFRFHWIASLLRRHAFQAGPWTAPHRPAAPGVRTAARRIEDSPIAENHQRNFPARAPGNNPETAAILIMTWGRHACLPVQGLSSPVNLSWRLESRRNRQTGMSAPHSKRHTLNCCGKWLAGRRELRFNQGQSVVHTGSGGPVAASCGHEQYSHSS